MGKRLLVPLLILTLVSVQVLADDGDVARRIDCHPEPGRTQALCEARSCVWSPPGITAPIATPSCYMKASIIGYAATKSGDNQWSLKKNNGPKTPWDADLTDLKLSVTDVGNNVVNVRIGPDAKRFDPQDLLKLPKETVASSAKLAVSVEDASNPFSFSVARGDGTKLFDTSIGGLIFADQFIQIAATIPSENMYGWGENIHPNLKHDFTRYTTWAMFSRDEQPNSMGLDTKNLYGVHPFYLVVENDGRAHGVFFLNANAQEVTTIPAPGFVYRTIGGVLDMTFFPGPTPADVIHQYTAFIGRSFLPAYWALGYQLSRWGYDSLQAMKDRIEAVRNYEIPLEIAYADIDYMERYKDFTVDQKLWSGFGDYVRQLHEWGMKVILIFDPAVQVDYDVFQRALDANVSFIEWERGDQVMHNIQDKYPMAKNTQIMLGVVWPDNHVAFPDFLDPTNKTDLWWSDEFARFHKDVPYDGAWIDMNEPSVFGTNQDRPWYYLYPDHPNDLQLICPLSGADSVWDKPPYETYSVWRYGENSSLTVNTMCMSAMTVRRTERFYNTKNLYGWAETRSTQAAQEAATGKRGAVIPRSTFPSSGRYGGHWLGDNSATWEDLRSAVIGAQEFNLFGIPYVGSDVCGFHSETNEELCLRWQQLGSFHSFYRNHNAKYNPPQDPAVWPSVAAATKRANEFRYTILPYFYSLHFRASLYGDTVVRPVFYEFPTDKETFGLSEQFMVGPGLLVAPVIYQWKRSVDAYIPTGSDFYSVYEHAYGQKIPSGLSSYPAPITWKTPAFVRGGAIIPRQSSATTTTAARAGNFNLLIAQGSGSDRKATGDFFWDDGDSLFKSFDSHNYTSAAFTYTLSDSGASLEIATTVARAPSLPRLAYLEIFDYPKAAIWTSLTLDKKSIAADETTSSYNPESKILTLAIKEPIDFSAAKTIQLQWSHESSTSSARISFIGLLTAVIALIFRQ